MTVFQLLRRYLVFCLVMGGVGAAYMLSKLPQLATPSLLPMTALDRAIPLIPASVWLYSSLTLLIFLVFVALPSWLEVRRFASGLLLATVCATTVFVLFPTTFPREQFPAASGVSVSLEALRSLREVDSASNCLPSLHVALASLCALALRRSGRGRGVRWGGGIWALGIVLATLTTKQHYLIDLPAGMLLAGLVDTLVCRALAATTLACFARPLGGLQAPQGVERLLAAVRAHQWKLEEIAWPEQVAPLAKPLEAFLNQLVAIEELAGESFAFLGRAAGSEDLRELYRLFAAEERRHAEVFREVLRLSGATPAGPGLGAALQLELFAALDPQADVDVQLVALAIPVFETFLDGGIIPFLQEHHAACGGEALQSALARVCHDERSHLAHNWRLARGLLADMPAGAQLRAALNPHLLVGVLTIPMIAFETFVRALRLGFDFSTLLPAFDKLGRQRSRHPELRRSALWTWFELFALVGSSASLFCWWLQRRGWLTGQRLRWLATGMGWLARRLFGPRQLRSHGWPLSTKVQARALLPQTG